VSSEPQRSTIAPEATSAMVQMTLTTILSTLRTRTLRLKALLQL
jgi:hypothetical protein